MWGGCKETIFWRTSFVRKDSGGSLKACRVTAQAGSDHSGPPAEFCCVGPHRCSKSISSQNKQSIALLILAWDLHCEDFLLRKLIETKEKWKSAVLGKSLSILLQAPVPTLSSAPPEWCWVGKELGMMQPRKTVCVLVAVCLIVKMAFVVKYPWSLKKDCFHYSVRCQGTF